MKQIITNYTFDASAQTITFNDYTSIELERLTLITNLTDGVIIYQFNNVAKGGTVTGNVLTLTFDTTTMADADDLQIFYEVETQLTPRGAQLIGTATDRFFDNFADFDTVNTWEQVQVGTGMVITGPIGGAAAGSSPYINIASGTDADQKTILLSRATFTPPFDLRYQITASQRIANNRFIIGFVQVDDNGAIVESTSITTAPEVLNARNAVVHQHDGTTATTAQLRVRAAGSALDTFANAFGTGFTTVATGTTPNFLTATMYGLTFEREKINSRAYGANIITNTGGQFGYDRVLPNPTYKYKLIVIVENFGTSPVSSTDWRLHLVNVMDATRLDVAPRSPGTTDLSKSFPVIGTVTANLGTGGTSSTSLGKARDAAAGSTDTGVSALRIRRDVPTAVTAAAGDYEPAQIDDKGRQYVIERCVTPTVTSVAASGTSVTVLALNNARAGATLYNDSTATAYVKLGATASTSSYTVKMNQDDYYEVPFGYIGVIDCIWSSATGNMLVTQLV